MLQQSVFKEYHGLIKYGLRLFDIGLVIGLAFLAFFHKFHTLQLPSAYQNTLWLSLLVVAACFHQYQLYSAIRGRSLWSYLVSVSLALVTSMALIGLLAFFTKAAVILSREWFLRWALYAWIALIISRCLLWVVMWLFRKQGWNPRRIVVIGNNPLAVQLVQDMQHTLGNGFQVIAFIDNHAASSQTTTQIPVRKMPHCLVKWLRLTRVQEVWIALPLSEEAEIKALLVPLREAYVTVRYVFDLFGMSLHQHSMTHISGFPVVNLLTTPLSGANRVVKWVEDMVLATLITILISPVLLCIALAVRLSSEGPILFKQKRHGSNGEEITVYKFRTMYLHQEVAGQVTQAKKNDARITSVGAFLRRTSLDELPQFFNVLQGRMSIVGPRPHAIAHNEHYRNQIESYMQRHRVKPGITGWAQVNGFRGETDTLEKMQRRVECDLYYIENWSFWLDLRIIFLTVFRGFFHKNAY